MSRAVDPSGGGGDSAVLEPLRMARYRFVATILEDMVLPPYKGSAFRGGFGGAFRRICCTCGEAACKGCAVMETCPYAYVFETRVPADSDRLRNIEDIPRPFIMEPPEDLTTLLKAGSLMQFNVVLAGRGIDFLPYFILAFKELGDTGLGRAAGCMGRRARFRLEAVDLLGFPPGAPAKPVYDGETGTVRPQATVTADDLARYARTLGGRDTLLVRFATPTRLKFNHQYVVNPDFHVLVRALLRRLSSLLYFH
ncbi:MAG: CRISPR system precrRNA processing endoribonuclease RAMP protein Cas6, partial [Bacillota bacterium]